MGTMQLLLVLLAADLVASIAITSSPTPPATVAWKAQLPFRFAAPTPFPKLNAPPGHSNDLDARAVITWTYATCGWTSKDADLPKTCPVGLGCGWWGGPGYTGNALACCPVDNSGEWNWGDCPYPTTCLTYGANNITATAYYSETYSSTLFCGVSAQKCATAFFDGGPGSSLIPTEGTSLLSVTYTSMFCTDAPTVINVYHSHTNALPSSSSVASSSSSKSTSGGGIQSGGGHAPASSTTGGSDSTSTPTPKPSPSKSSNAGVIAGATVGGVVGIAAIAAVFGYLVWRKKEARRNAPREISQQSMSQYSYPSPGPQSYQ